MLPKSTSKTHVDFPEGLTRVKAAPEAKVFAGCPKPEPKKDPKMNKKMVQKAVEFLACFSGRFRKPSEGYKGTKMHPKTWPETVASHSQREQLRKYISTHKNHSESESDMFFATIYNSFEDFRLCKKTSKD